MTPRTSAARPREIAVDVCVNDDYGTTTNRLHSVHVPGLELSAIDVAGVHFRLVPGGFYVSRRKWIARHVQSCIGNIYWERFGCEPWALAAQLHKLRDTKLFTAEGGAAELYDWFDSSITDEAFVMRQLVECANDGL